jgi:hypothetical protein
MLLNGKRLGNLSAIEAIPNKAIVGFQQNQINALGQNIAGEIQYNAGSRDGVGGPYSQVKDCKRIAISADSDGLAIASLSRTRSPMLRSSK